MSKMKEIIGALGVLLILLSSIFSDQKTLSLVMAIVGFIFLLVSLVMIMRNKKEK